MKIIKVVNYPIEERKINGMINTLESFDFEKYHYDIKKSYLRERGDNERSKKELDFKYFLEAVDSYPEYQEALQENSEFPLFSNNTVFSLFSNSIISRYDTITFAKTINRTFYKELQQHMYGEDSLYTNIVMDFDQVAEAYPKTKNISIGYYTIHPSDMKALMKVENFHEATKMDKDNELIYLLGELGAKKISIEEHSISNNKSKGKGSVNTFIAEGNANIKMEEKVSENKTIHTVFYGGLKSISPDLLIDSSWYHHDGQMNMLHQSRMGANPMKSFTITQTYKESFDFDFDLAAKILKVNIDLKAEYHKVSDISRNFNVEFFEH